MQWTFVLFAVLVLFLGIPAKQDESEPSSVSLLLDHVAHLGNTGGYFQHQPPLNGNADFFQTVASTNFTAGLDVVESESRLVRNLANRIGKTVAVDNGVSDLTDGSMVESEPVALSDASENSRHIPYHRDNDEETGLLAYAPAMDDEAEAEELIAVFDLLESKGTDENADSHNWIYGELPIGVVSESEQKCLAEAVYFEARGESTEGQVAVAQVVLNRVRDSRYPNSICKVVYQNETHLHRCQFSFACDGISERIHSIPAWKKAQKVADNVTHGISHLKNVGESTHFHAVYVDPSWAKTMEKKAKIGMHIFYLAKL